MFCLQGLGFALWVWYVDWMLMLLGFNCCFLDFRFDVFCVLLLLLIWCLRIVCLVCVDCVICAWRLCVFYVVACLLIEVLLDWLLRLCVFCWLVILVVSWVIDLLCVLFCLLSRFGFGLEWLLFCLPCDIGLIRFVCFWMVMWFYWFNSVVILLLLLVIRYCLLMFIVCYWLRLNLLWLLFAC